VLVEEPSVESTIAILRGLQEKYELHHGVDITDPAIVAAAELSHRYITDRFLPDKAIDLIDEAAARIKMEIDSKPEVMDKLDRRIIQLKIEREAVKKEKDEASKKRWPDRGRDRQADQGILRSGRNLEGREIGCAGFGPDQGRNRSSESRHQSSAARRQLGEVAELQYGKLPQLEAQLKAAEKAGDGEQKKNRLLRTQVGAEEIAEVVSRATGIPVSKMMQGERKAAQYGRQAAPAGGRAG
jgi:ATP-dependent Clp protease ATP-binding subunit ClpB